MTLNEANEFLLTIGQLSNIEIENSASTIPTSELEQWEDCIQKVMHSDEFKRMQKLLDRWNEMDKKSKM